MEEVRRKSEKEFIVKEVKSRIAQGIPKQKILEELSFLYKDKVTIVKQLEKTPSIEKKTQYLLYNNILSILLLLALAADIMTLYRIDNKSSNLITYFTALNICLDVIFCIGVISFKIETYSWIATRALTSLIVIIVSYWYYYQTVDILAFISLGLIVTSFVLGLLLAVKLCPTRIPESIEVRINEKEKIKKTVYVFPD